MVEQMKHIYIIQFNTSDGYYSHSYIERTAFTTIEKAIDYIKREYGNAEERTLVSNESVKEFDLIPYEEYYGDAEWLEILKVEVE